MENREWRTGNSEPANGTPDQLARSPFSVPGSRFSIFFLCKLFHEVFSEHTPFVRAIRLSALRPGEKFTNPQDVPSGDCLW